MNETISTQRVADVPLVVDMDGTLAKVDTLHESFVQLLARHPLAAVSAFVSHRGNRAAFKAAVADHVVPAGHAVPLNDAVVDLIAAARSEGRKVYLATASDVRVATAVADAFGGFDGIFASENGTNLKGQAKADRLVAVFGARGFDYVGNGAVDVPVWKAARKAFVVDATRRLIERIKRERPDVIPLGGARKFSLAPYLWAMRPHQWLKNVLVAVPAVAGHDFSTAAILTLAAAFVSFSLGASSLYIINDLLDLPNDRVHQEKRHRSLAAGQIPVDRALALFFVLASLSLGLAALLPLAYFVTLIGYLALSLSYSLYLKRKLMIDVVALAALYGIRVVAGGAAVAIPLSHWLVGFCFFIFLSLALMKRTTEMMLLPPSSVGKIKGRGYRRADLPVIHALTSASGFVAVLVLALYINSPDIKTLYSRPDLLWGICIILVYWLGRAFFLTGRGEMRQDPVVFAATDRISLQAGVLVAGVFLAAL